MRGRRRSLGAPDEDRSCPPLRGSFGHQPRQQWFFGCEDPMNGQLMREEMAQQVPVPARLESSRDETVDLVRAIAPRPLHGVLFVARGSSDNASLHARYVME